MLPVCIFFTDDHLILGNQLVLFSLRKTSLHTQYYLVPCIKIGPSPTCFSSSLWPILKYHKLWYFKSQHFIPSEMLETTTLSHGERERKKRYDLQGKQCYCPNNAQGDYNTIWHQVFFYERNTGAKRIHFLYNM